MDIAFLTSSTDQTNAVVVGMHKDNTPTKAATELDLASNGALMKAVEGSYFKGKHGQTLVLNGLENHGGTRVLVVGLGEAKDLDEKGLTNLGATIYKTLAVTPDVSAEVRLEDFEAETLTGAQALATIAQGALLRSWRFDKYRTKEDEDKKPKLKTMNFVASFAEQADKHFDTLKKITDGVFMTRDLVSEPANVLYPETLAKRAEELKSLGVTVEVLDEAQMKNLGMGALLGVGQGSIRESKLVVMQWNGAGKDQQPVAFVGKGVTFDTGGISIKPANNMHEMKWDMGGSGVVIGTMKALAGRKAKVNAVGVVGLVENMPGSNAQRPGDVVKTMSGQTVEVLNTDAEGRLVLADALWYTQDRFSPKFMVDLATLTMAVIIALGHEYAGLFSNNDELSERLTKTGEKLDEKVHRLPLHATFDKDIDSDVADVQNINRTPYAASSITAAQFLQRFTNDVPWAHLDIAGTTWNNKGVSVAEKGATGFGVRLLDRMVFDYYESA